MRNQVMTGIAMLLLAGCNDRGRAAVHEFLAFQRSDHRAAGHPGH
jgi:hypothetical protein